MKRLIGLLALSLVIFAARAAEFPIPAAFGPYMHPSAKEFADSMSFRTSDRIVGTYYFYWYDVPTKAHIVNSDGSDALTTHPATLNGLSYKSVAWHRRQLEDMTAAGIDVVLPVFWGAPSEHNPRSHFYWSYEGLRQLVQAREELLREGEQPPRIGLFYDTTTLQSNAWGEHVDLGTQRGQQWFYGTVRDFFSMVPAKHWAMIDGRPIVLLYSAAFAKRQDQAAIDFTKVEFARDFGGRVPWIAREMSWRVNADCVYAWGGALGLKNPGGIATLGPGYDHSAVPGRKPLVVDRRGGAFYEEQWTKFLRRPANFVMVETWNEWHEGTGIAESREYGRQYIQLTRKYADLFKAGWKPPSLKGPFTNASSVSIRLGAVNQGAGLRQVENEDGLTEPATFSGHAARKTKRSKWPTQYIYFIVDDSFKPAKAANLILEVEFFDAAPGTLGVEFDGSDVNAAFSGAYTTSPNRVRLDGGKRWRTANFCLPQARLLNRQNGSADLRLVVDAKEFAIRSAVLRIWAGSRICRAASAISRPAQFRVKVPSHFVIGDARVS